MRSRFTRLAAAALGAGMLAGPLAGTALAHERRTVGTVQMTVGWLNEPAYSGFLNAVQLRLADDAGPITDVTGDALKVEVSFGGQKQAPAAMAPAFGSPGEYRAALVPDRPGVYSFRFVGTVKGQQVDQTFTSSDKTFDSPRDTADVQFPAKDPTTGELAARVDRLDPRVEQVRTDALAKADDAKSAASRATVLAVVGLLVGVAGIAFGVTARRRGPAGPGAGSRSAAKVSTGS
jgi:hypothetical protein